MDGFPAADGMSGQQVYDRFMRGMGGQALAPGVAVMKDLIESYGQRAQSITALTVRMESAWQGDAAGAAQRGAGPLAVEHGLAAPQMNGAQDTLTQQISAFDTAKNSVTPVPGEPKQPGFWDNVTSLGGAGRTYEQQHAAYNAANDNNVAVLSTYERATTQNTAGMATSYGSIAADNADIGGRIPCSAARTPTARMASTSSPARRSSPAAGWTRRMAVSTSASPATTDRRGAAAAGEARGGSGGTAAPLTQSDARTGPDHWR